MAKLLSTKEAAEFLHVSLRTFKYLTRAKKIAPVQIGAKGAKFYSPVQLEEFRSANCTRANRCNVEKKDPCNSEVQITPVQIAPVQITPVQIAPVQITPVQIAPVQIAPVQIAPVQTRDTRITEAKKFFDLLYGNLPAGSFGYLWTLPNRITYPFEVSDENQRLAMAKKAVALSDSPAKFSVYHGVNCGSVRLSSSERYKADDSKGLPVTLQTAIVVDIDIRSGAHKGNPENFPHDFETAKSLLPLQPSILVTSGYGLHAYYIFGEAQELTDNATRKNAEELNRKMLELIRIQNPAYKKSIDAVEDLPRILRTPSTFNYKLDNAQPLCHVVETSDKRFSATEISTFLKEALSAKKLNESEVQQTRANSSNTIDRYASPIPETDRALAMLSFIPCSEQTYSDWIAVGMILKTNGNSCEDWEQWSRPDNRFKEGECAKKWTGFSENGTLTIATLHRLAKFCGYSEKDFQREWYANNPTFSRQNSKIPRRKIADCPLDLEIPADYSLSHNGIMKLLPKKGGEGYSEIPVSRTPLIVTKRFAAQNSTGIEYELAFKTPYVPDHWLRKTVDATTIADSKKIVSLSELGISVSNAKLLTAYLDELINSPTNAQKIKSVKIFNRPGWNGDTFVYPTTSAEENYIVRRAGIDYESIFATKGDADQWKEKFREVIRGQQGCLKRIVLGACLAAPILKVIGLPNIQLHLEGTSNFAKSPLPKFGLSVFGNPKEGALLRGWNSTEKNRLAIAAGFCDFPQGLDELESMSKRDEEALSQNIYSFALGIVNQANKRNGDVRQAEHFRSVRISTGERGILKITDKRGAFKRVVTLRVNAPLFDDEYAHKLHLFAEKNFGHFGRKWTEYISSNSEKIFSDFERTCAHFIKEGFSRNHQLVGVNSIDKTNFRAVIACAVAFYHFCVCIDLTVDFNNTYSKLDAEKILGELPTVEEMSDVKRGLELLASWIAEHPRNFITPQKINGVPVEGADEAAESYTETVGKKFADGQIAFYPNAFRKIVERDLGLPSYEKFLNDLFTEDLLICNNRREKSMQKKINGENQRVYLLKAETFLQNLAEGRELIG